MNQIQVLLTHLNDAKTYRATLTSPNIPAQSGWQRITGIKSPIPLLNRMNELSTIALNLHKSHMLDNEIDKISDDSGWIHEVINALSLHGNFGSNMDQLHNHTLTIIRTSMRSWNEGYKIQSTLDQEKINELVAKLGDERNSILSDENLTTELKKLLLKEIDKIIYSLTNYSILGEEFVKNAVTDFYSEAFFNKDIQKYYNSEKTSLKEIIEAISTSITIGTFIAPMGPLLLGMATEVITKIT